MHYKHCKKRQHHLNKIGRIGLFYLLASIGFALTSTIWAVFIESFVKNASYVGFITTFFTLVGIASYILLIPFVERNSKTKLLGFSIFAISICYLVFFFYSNIYLALLIGTFLSILGSLRITAFGILVRDCTKSKDVSKNEGLVYTFANLAWLIGPLFAGYFAYRYGFGNTFLIAFVFVFLAFLFFRKFKIKDTRKSKKVDHDLLKVCWDFFKDKERRSTYILGAAITFWWALTFVYVPVMIVESGLSDFVVGVFLSASILPLVLFEYPFGKLAGKKGFRKVFVLGFSILGFSALICFFVSNIYLILGILALASVGMAMLEATTEAYFFDVVKEKDRDKYYGPYNTAVDVGYFLGSLPPAIILLFFSFNSIFLFFSLVMFLMVFFAFKVRNIIEFKHKN